jgi:hypothetical protein
MDLVNASYPCMPAVCKPIKQWKRMAGAMALTFLPLRHEDDVNVAIFATEQPMRKPHHPVFCDRRHHLQIELSCGLAVNELVANLSSISCHAPRSAWQPFTLHSSTRE